MDGGLIFAQLCEFKGTGGGFCIELSRLISQFCYELLVQPWTSHLTSPSLIFLLQSENLCSYLMTLVNVIFAMLYKYQLL